MLKYPRMPLLFLFLICNCMISRSFSAEPHEKKQNKSLSPAVSADNSIRRDNITLTPFKIQLVESKNKKGKLEYLPSDEDVEIIPAWPGVDAFCHNNGLYFIAKDKTARKIAALDSPAKLIFEGSFLWIYQVDPERISIIDKDGKILGKIDSGSGLPKSDIVFIMHPVAPGKILIAGTVAPLGLNAQLIKRRSWIGIAEYANKKTAFKIFHEAKKQFPDDAPIEQQNAALLDAEIAFEPQYISTHADEKGKKYYFIVCGISALVVDGDNLKVSAYRPILDNDHECDSFPHGSSASCNGIYYTLKKFDYGQDSIVSKFKFDPESMRLKLISSQDMSKHRSQGLSSAPCNIEGKILHLEDALIVQTFMDEIRLINLKTEEERKLPAPVEEDSFLSNPRYLFMTNNFGLVKPSDETFYQIRY